MTKDEKAHELQLRDILMAVQNENAKLRADLEESRAAQLGFVSHTGSSASAVTIGDYMGVCRELIKLRAELVAAEATIAELTTDGNAVTLAANLAKVSQELASAREDAERLDWLAHNGGGFAHDEADRGICTTTWGEWALHPITSTELRAAIDAALKGNK